jgi:hypothetical protein
MVNCLITAISVLLFCAACAAHPEPSAPAPHPHRGHRWVRSHPYTIMGLTRTVPMPFDIKQYRAAGFTSLLAWEPSSYDVLLPQAAADGLPWHLHLEHWGEEYANRPNSTEQTLREGLQKLDSEENRARLHKLLENFGCIGIMVNDEALKPLYLRYTRRLLQWVREQHPDAIAYGNMHPAGHDNPLAYGTVEGYYDEFAAMLEPDVLMTNIYPLGDPKVDVFAHTLGHPVGETSNYFHLIAAVRTTALNHGMPYWNFIQSFESTGNWIRRLPSESDLRVQMFAPLTYGYTGIIYFTYDVAFERGLIEMNGEPNSLYHAAAKANPEVANVGAAMRFLTSTDVRYVPGRHNDGDTTIANKLPTGTKAWAPGAGGDDRIESVSIEQVGDGRDALIGLFRDDAGVRCFMITNLWHGANASAADRSLTVAVKFAPDVHKLYRLDRATGSAVRVDLDHRVLRTTLPGGTGDLYRYTDKPFPGT